MQDLVDVVLEPRVQLRPLELHEAEASLLRGGGSRPRLSCAREQRIEELARRAEECVRRRARGAQRGACARARGVERVEEHDEALRPRLEVADVAEAPGRGLGLGRGRGAGVHGAVGGLAALGCRVCEVERQKGAVLGFDVVSWAPMSDQLDGLLLGERCIPFCIVQKEPDAREDILLEGSERYEGRNASCARR